jgi:hypothetical protein
MGNEGDLIFQTFAFSNGKLQTAGIKTVAAFR